MGYAIVINLDYENNPSDECQEIWDVIKLSMLEAGFRLDSRIFVINRTHDEAISLARSVIEDLEGHLDFEKKRVFRYIKTFYGYDMTHTTNLLVPDSNKIEVSDSVSIS